MERSNYFVQITTTEEPLVSILFKPDGLSQKVEPDAAHIVIRRERQIFRRLPRSGGTLFSVKTSLTYLRDLEKELGNLAKEIKSWPEDVGH